MEVDAFLDKKLVFIGGLHRSGTSVLHQILGNQYNVSRFINTGVPEDEGQHLQTVYPTARKFGGPGKFGFTKEAHLTNSSELINEANRTTILNEWGKHWDFEKDMLLEKSPPNIIRFSFLQSMFLPINTYHIMITRHPLIVSLATKKWARDISLNLLIEHWLHCHSLFYEDKKKIKNILCLSYEQLVLNTDRTMDAIALFLGLSNLSYNGILHNYNNDYYDEASKSLEHIDIKKYESQVNDYGYSLLDFKLYPSELTKSHI